MKVQVVTLFPKLIEGYFNEGVVGQAVSRGQVELEFINPREFTKDVHHTVDDRPYGGGDGMVMMAEPLQQCLAKAHALVPQPELRRIYLTPRAKT